MLKVFKYPVTVSDYQTVNLPKGAEILTVKPQGRATQLYLWVLVDPDAEEQNESRQLRIAGTGHPIEHEMSELKYINTFFINEGRLVFHVFEIKKS